MTTRRGAPEGDFVCRYQRFGRWLRRDAVSSAEEVAALREALESGDTIVTTGLILQELLQGLRQSSQPLSVTHLDVGSPG